MRNFSGAVIRRVVDRSHASVPEHAHDWPLLSLFVLGGYASRTELGETSIDGPSVVLYRAGALHRNVAGASGFEQIEIEFDPDWLGDDCLPRAPVSQWIGGVAGAQSRDLVRLCREENEPAVRVALRRFLAMAKNGKKCCPPSWVKAITGRVRENASVSVSTLAADVARHPSWAGAAYREATGERILETAARFRVERAARLLRETDRALAAIAVDSGFCDQSHMNRSFRRVLGRTPAKVRGDRVQFREG